MAVGIKIFVLLLNLVASGHLQKQVTGAGGSASGSAQYNQPHNGHSHLIFNRSYSEDSWLRSLAWNLFGYATVIIPAYLAIRVVRNSDQFNERDGESQSQADKVAKALFNSVYLRDVYFLETQNYSSIQ